jgi:UDP-N-acetyl-D-mannosaminuronic acid dehydrogenase
MVMSNTCREVTFYWEVCMKINKVCICGIGYVGLTLAVVMAEKGFDVTGVEIRPEVVKSLNSGEPHFHEAGLGMLLSRHINRNLRIAAEIPDETFDAFIITVGTPLKKESKEPELKYILSVAEEISKHLHDSCLVILRSTVAIGTARNVVLPVLQKECNQVNIAFCPERTLEGKALEELKYLPQVIGGINGESMEMAVSLFRRITPTIIEVSSLETAEMIKLLDNAYRDLHFAFANEVAQICEHIGIDAMEVIKSGKIGYSRTNIPVPGYVGGACLEKDPHILVYSCNQFHYTPGLVKYGREIHESIPLVVLNRIEQLLACYGKDLKNAKIFITGMAFKGEPETDDLRGSPSLIFTDALTKLRVNNMFVHDFVVKEEEMKKVGLTPLSIQDGFKDADVVIIGNNHGGYRGQNILQLVSTMNKPAILYDSWRLFDKKLFADVDGIHYEGLGFQQEAFL